MTVVAAVARDGQVVIAADRATNYKNQAAWGARKVRRIDVATPGMIRREALLALAGHGGGLAAVLQSPLDLPPMPFTDVEDDLDDWADAMAAATTGILAGLQPPLLDDDGDGMSATGADYLLGVNGRLWYLFTHHACRVVDGVAAIGIGSEVALGAMHVALAHAAAPLTATAVAVDLACRLSPGCSLGPTGKPLIETLGEQGDGRRPR